MEDVEGTIVELPRTTEEAYLRILGVDKIPERIKDMPPEIFIPPQTLGDLEQSIILGMQDGRERSQLVGYANNKYPKGMVIVGGKGDASYKDSIMRGFHAMFGRKSLIYYHTHAGEPYSLNRNFSEPDKAIMAGFPRLAFMFLLGWDKGVTALLQTKKSTKLPTYAFFEIWNTLRKMNKGEIDFEDLGLEYYWWENPSGLIKKGDLAMGVKLKGIPDD